MNPRELAALETALGLTEPLPLSNSQREENELVQLRLAADLRGPARMRKSGEVFRVIQLLDEIGKEGHA